MARKRTTKKTTNRRRKGVLAVLIPWMRRFGVGVAVFAFIVWVGAWLWLSGAVRQGVDWTHDRVMDITADAGFSVRNIMVEGRVYSDPDIIKAIVNVQTGDSLFLFDPVQARETIERMIWVRSARAERRFPDTIYIRLEERTPVALWQKDKKLKVIDENGDVITDRKLGRFKDLMIVIGDDAPQRAADLIVTLAAEPSVFERAKAATRIGGRRWNLTLESGLVVELPEKDVGYAIRRLAQAQKEDKLLDRDITNIDVRDTTKIVVRTRPGAVQEYKASFEAGNDV